MSWVGTSPASAAGGGEGGGECGGEGGGEGGEEEEEGGLAVVAAGENADDEKKLGLVHAALWKHHHVLLSIFDFYATMGGGFDGLMTMNP